MKTLPTTILQIVHKISFTSHVYTVKNIIDTRQFINMNMNGFYPFKLNRPLMTLPSILLLIVI